MIKTSLGYGALRALDSIRASTKKAPKAIENFSVDGAFIVIDTKGENLATTLESVQVATDYIKKFVADIGEPVTIDDKRAVQGARDLLTGFGTLPRVVRASYPKEEASEQEPETHSTTGSESANTVSSQLSDNETENEDNGETSDQTKLNPEGLDDDSGN